MRLQRSWLTRSELPYQPLEKKTPVQITPRPIVAAGALALALTLAGCGTAQDQADPAGAGTEAPETTGTATTEPSSEEEVDQIPDDIHNDVDTVFAQTMIVHHEGAIEMADLGVEKAASEEVRTLAERISAAQGPEIEQMTSWLEDLGKESSPMEEMDGHDGMDMDGMSQEEAMTELEGLSGIDFDRRFLQLMIAHHQGALTMAEEEIYNGQNRTMLELGKEIKAEQQDEIAEMEEILQGL